MRKGIADLKLMVWEYRSGTPTSADPFAVAYRIETAVKNIESSLTTARRARSKGSSVKKTTQNHQGTAPLFDSANAEF